MATNGFTYPVNTCLRCPRTAWMIAQITRDDRTIITRQPLWNILTTIDCYKHANRPFTIGDPIFSILHHSDQMQEWIRSVIIISELCHEAYAEEVKTPKPNTWQPNIMALWTSWNGVYLKVKISVKRLLSYMLDYPKFCYCIFFSLCREWFW